METGARSVDRDIAQTSGDPAPLNDPVHSLEHNVSISI
jgi:hypothetical protein